VFAEEAAADAKARKAKAKIDARSAARVAKATAAVEKGG